MVRQAMSIRDVAAQSANWPASKLDDEPEKNVRTLKGRCAKILRHSAQLPACLTLTRL